MTRHVSLLKLNSTVPGTLLVTLQRFSQWQTALFGSPELYGHCLQGWHFYPGCISEECFYVKEAKKVIHVHIYKHDSIHITCTSTNFLQYKTANINV